MIPCPSCQQPVEILDKHLGTLFTCPHCNSVYFIDWSGQPELAQHEPVYSTEDNFDDSLNQPQNTENEFITSGDFNSPEVASPADAGEPFSSSEESLEELSTEDDQQVLYGENPPIEEAPYDFGQTLDAVSESSSLSSSDSPDFSDVTSFANNDSAAGPLTYTVIIEGIESSLQVSQLKEAMTDSRFAWDVTEILNQIGGGHLVLKGLSPAKASVLINRIKYLPFKISWRQDVLSSS